MSKSHKRYPQTMDNIQEQIGALQEGLKQLHAHALSVQKHIKEKIPTRIAALEELVRTQEKQIKELQASQNMFTATTKMNTSTPRFEMICCESIIVGKTEGQPGIMITSDSDSANISFMNDTTTQISIGLDSQGNCSIDMSDKHGNKRINALIDEDCCSSVTWSDSEGNDSIKAGVDEDGTVYLPTGETPEETGRNIGNFTTLNCKTLNLVDKNGQERIVASVLADGQAGILWRDQEGKSKIAASVALDGSPSISLFDHQGTYRIMVGLDSDGNAALALLDSKKQLRIAAATNSDGTIELPTQDEKKK